MSENENLDNLETEDGEMENTSEISENDDEIDGEQL
jgi:hypothetical protein